LLLVVVVVATVAAVASAACKQQTVYPKNGGELRIALQTANAGTTIVLAHGVTYSLDKDVAFLFSANGGEDCPVLITTDEPSLGYATIANFLYVSYSNFVTFANVSFAVDGTAVQCSGKDILFENARFSTKKSATSSGFGIIIMSDSSRITLRKCEFVNNDGVAAVLSQSVSHISFEECNFTNNTRDMTVEPSSDISITESVFVGRPVLHLDKVGKMDIRHNLFVSTDDSQMSVIYLDNIVDAQGIRNNFFVKDKGNAIVSSCNVCASNKVVGKAPLTIYGLDYNC